MVIDVFHVWHDPDLYQEIEKLQGRILGLHVSDWPVPLPGILMGRTMMGDGVIELPASARPSTELATRARSRLRFSTKRSGTSLATKCSSS